MVTLILSDLSEYGVRPTFQKLSLNFILKVKARSIFDGLLQLYLSSIELEAQPLPWIELVNDGFESDDSEEPRREPEDPGKSEDNEDYQRLRPGGVEQRPLHGCRRHRPDLILAYQLSNLISLDFLPIDRSALASKLSRPADTVAPI